MMALAADPRRVATRSERKKQYSLIDWSLGFSKSSVPEYAREELRRRDQYGSGGVRGRAGSTEFHGVSGTIVEWWRSLDTLLKGVLGGLGLLSLLALLSD